MTYPIYKKLRVDVSLCVRVEIFLISVLGVQSNLLGSLVAAPNSVHVFERSAMLPFCNVFLSMLPRIRQMENNYA